MKVLLTGGAGFIGAHTCLEMLLAGYDVAVADDYSNSSPEALERVRELAGRDFAWYRADVADKSAMRVIFERERPQAAIHFAGFKAVGESVEKPLAYYRNNLDTTLTLLELMKEYGVRKIVFSSSATVYSVNEGAAMMDETLPTGCTNPYGWTKYMNEQILRDAARAEGLAVMLLRYFNPVGAHESGRIGEDPNGIPNNLMPRVLQNAQGRIKVLGVYGNDYPTPDGTCIRDYIHVVDLARGHVAALRYLEGCEACCEAVNLGTGVGYSVLDILRTFEKVTGVPLRYEIQPRRPGDAAACCANPEKAARLLGWRAEKTLADMCRDAWRWQCANPDGYERRDEHDGRI